MITRRTLIKTGGFAALGSLAFTAPACPSSATKEKAVKYVGLVVDLAKEAVPLLNLLNQPTIAEIVNTKVIPALEKLKDALADVNIPEAQSTLTTVRNALGAVATALLQLPESARRTTIIGILTSARILLLTIEAFIDSEMPVPAASARSASERASMSGAINKVFEATQP